VPKGLQSGRPSKGLSDANIAGVQRRRGGDAAGMPAALPTQHQDGGHCGGGGAADLASVQETARQGDVRRRNLTQVKASDHKGPHSSSQDKVSRCSPDATPHGDDSNTPKQTQDTTAPKSVIESSCARSGVMIRWCVGVLSSRFDLDNAPQRELCLSSTVIYSPAARSASHWAPSCESSNTWAV